MYVYIYIYIHIGIPRLEDVEAITRERRAGPKPLLPFFLSKTV